MIQPGSEASNNAIGCINAGGSCLLSLFEWWTRESNYCANEERKLTVCATGDWTGSASPALL